MGSTQIEVLECPPTMIIHLKRPGMRTEELDNSAHKVRVAMEIPEASHHLLRVQPVVEQ